MLPSDDEALQSDLYLERLLATHGREPLVLHDERLDPHLRDVAELLDQALVRFHPSFRFEEALAARLRSAGDALAAPSQFRGVAIPFPRLAVASRGIEDAHDLRGVLMGGVLASGVSLAGAAAWFVWRHRSRREGAA